ncbi:hypothetical protein O7635_26020 [Asanoa sp. WMMD1127]|uniref:hypothetical protein n=1 Tax=Asanoa sp. WMMD1127 TaxID=3016107 RepID=UPI002416DB29|nr:hypothetical protein [Asanoa sp. WMMD1127]MDG4825319.1 hypothetical protein [Asanoa sp. WMMD1127]
MSRRAKGDTFESEVERQFGPVAARFGLTGPTAGGFVLPTVAWAAGTLAYTWMLDDEDQAVMVSAGLDVPEGRLATFVADLVPALGLGKPQDVRTSARTWHSLRQAVASHVEWIARLHPDLSGDDARATLERAAARLRR